MTQGMNPSEDFEHELLSMENAKKFPKVIPLMHDDSSFQDSLNIPS